MEKIRVNMTPCEEVKTIHASQDDNATRKWAFDLYDENGKIDSSDIKEQMIFDSRVGGTEQILPENTSVPTTSPIIADIQYPDSLRSEQTFLYRESPTQEDGQAKITHIKGNTVVFNQLASDGNFADTSGWAGNVNGTYTVSNNIATVVPAGKNSGIRTATVNQKTLIPNHKYFLRCEIKTDGTHEYVFGLTRRDNYNWIGNNVPSANISDWQKLSTIVQYTGESGVLGGVVCIANVSTTASFQIKNIMWIDLTQMGLDTLTVDQFTSLYPLPYYDYTQGKLLPFKGASLKITGKNLIDASQVQVGKAWNNQSNTARACTFVAVKPNTQYTFSIDGLNGLDGIFCACESVIGTQTSPNVSFSLTNSRKTFTFTTPNDCKYLAVQGNKTDITKADYVRCNFQLEFGSSASLYEPYTSSTINLPTLTYFSSGMKSAGNIYDEITESKAITRVGSVDLGSLDYFYTQSTNSMSVRIVSLKKTASNSVPANILTTIGKTIPADDRATATGERIYAFADDNVVYFRDIGYTDPTTFKNAMSGVYLYYELATPTETSFTTASLATENAEIPLSNDNGTLIGKCTEQLSENPGFFDAKIKLTDSDGECYSNKIQLHIERSPQ